MRIRVPQVTGEASHTYDHLSLPHHFIYGQMGWCENELEHVFNPARIAHHWNQLTGTHWQLLALSRAPLFRMHQQAAGSALTVAIISFSIYAFNSPIHSMPATHVMTGLPITTAACSHSQMRTKITRRTSRERALPLSACILIGQYGDQRSALDQHIMN